MGLIGRWMAVYGEAIYEGRPYGAGSVGGNYLTRSADGRSLYLFAPDLGRRGSANVVVGGKYTGAYAFGGVADRIRSIRWMDNGEELSFVQGEGMLCVNLTGFPYGSSFGVRVAKAEIE